ncbi:MAG: macro domain-containing protein [Erysipelotrichaceae bacterium]|nr:macro domain-containing protein [Erysipelotrichaceae bacterium]MDP3306527.1 macro domain-containing protein [Erysipelotrichaceae bacterium]
MPLLIVRNDITKMKVDAIVNATNPMLKMGGGVSGAIFTIAGRRQLQDACDQIGHCAQGEAVITPGFDLPAKYVIHTVGPVWHGGVAGESEQLADCYTHSLELAKKHGCESIAFPLVSSGTYRYPKQEAMNIAISAISQFLFENDMTVYLVVYDAKAFMLSKQLFTSIEKFIDDNYVEEQALLYRRTSARYQRKEDSERNSFENLSSMNVDASVRSLDDIVNQQDESFSESLFRLIDQRKLKDSEVYKKANIDRRLFSKIRNSDYHPSKNTCIALSIALKLNMDQMKDLLAKAGYTLSKSQKSDLIIEYHILNNQFDILQINEALFTFKQPILGA